MIPHLVRCLDRAGMTVTQLEAFTASAHSAVYRLEFADGRRAKVREYRHAAAAGDIDTLLRAARGDLPRPILRCGRHLIVEFVDGTPLHIHLRDASPLAARDFARATGALLARLHGRRLAPERRALAHAPTWYRRWIVRAMARLRQRRLIAARTADALLALSAPARARTGLSHGDLCPENLVVTPDGRVRAIDEERLSVRPRPFDLARVVTRWPLDASLESVFLDGYRTGGGTPDEYLAHRPFWLAVTLATSALYRLRYHPTRLRQTLVQIRALARSDG